MLIFFKVQSEKFLIDYNDRTLEENANGLTVYTHLNPKFFDDIEDVIMCFDINEFAPFTLIDAQEVIAYLAGFNDWQELTIANEHQLELGVLLFENRNKFNDGYIMEEWDMYLRLNDLVDSLTDESKLELFKEVFLRDE